MKANNIINIDLGENQVAILDFETKQVDIIEIPDLDEVEDVEECLDALGYNLSGIAYMC